MIDEKQLAPEEMDRYREVYCGVCHSLKDQSGQLCRMALTYDMTFLALLLNSLYEPSERKGAERCAAHPTKPQPFATSECTEYAADATVVLAYHKLLDDWNDDRKISRRAAAGLLRSAYREASGRRPSLARAVEEGMDDIRAIEQARNASLDEAANRFGLVLGEVFAYRDDFWKDDLTALGAYLGKFVYLMDAVMDFDDDVKSGSYNPLVEADTAPRDMEEALRIVAAKAARAFERLPLEQDIHILRNSIYAGIWGQYCGKFGVPGEREGAGDGADGEPAETKRACENDEGGQATCPARDDDTE